MATVFAAEDTLLGRVVAVKVLGAHFASDEAAIERFSREARAAARVSDHPHVATIYDIGEMDDGTPFIVMEHFAGGTVADRLKAATPISRRQALAWLDAAASALDHAHRHGIVHRDVKPGNLLLDEHGRLAVGDFGIARMASDAAGLTQTGTVLGTAAYLSPEQALGEDATAASDRYSLAVVAFELLTGRRPFGGEHIAAQARAHVETPPPAASEVDDTLPMAVDRALWRGLEKDPDRRWRSCCDMVEALEDGVIGTEAERTAPTRAVPPRAVPPRAVPSREAADDEGPGRRRFGWGVLVALASVLLLAGAAIAALALNGGGGNGDRSAGGAAQTTATARSEASRSDAGKSAAKARKKAKRRQKAQQAAAPPAASAPETQTSPPETQQATTQEQAPPEQAPPSGSSSELQAQGHNQIAQGDYAGAIASLQQAVQDCPVSQTDPCAYALYDLGHALRLAGRPSEAVDVLQVRLQNPDQQGTVQAELAAAQQAAGEAGGAGPAGRGKGHANGRD
ncbi:Serine/threonine-protein kinase PknD [Capillimicrobium parvum]|uniref:non-specific serine/threonine protein kinase n=2 Tax=Capillimicrobium parvum TaxID=2884022 RepID=A0A9E6XXX4_9ACTN|nr:Serine/threonine-protein kinase PknD [Capillimicrobium parvum]